MAVEADNKEVIDMEDMTTDQEVTEEEETEIEAVEEEEMTDLMCLMVYAETSSTLVDAGLATTASSSMNSLVLVVAVAEAEAMEEAKAEVTEEVEEMELEEEEVASHLILCNRTLPQANQFLFWSITSNSI